MKLFDFPEPIEILPFDGRALYFGPVIDGAGAFNWLNLLIEKLQWKNDEVFIFGKHHVTGRKTAWYGDRPYRYQYSNTVKEALPWPQELLTLKGIVEVLCGNQFNSCLANLYQTGEDSMGWHSDDEKTIEQSSAIASLSLGADRKFCLRHKRKLQNISATLENGSLLLMLGTTQQNWLHSLPKTKKVTTPRINLTFRRMVEQQF